MKTLLEALIGRYNVSNAHTVGLNRVLERFSKKDLVTGDMVILKDKSIGMFISGKDMKDSDEFVSQQYACKDGIFIFPNWYKKDAFEYCDINDYENDLSTPSNIDDLSVKYIIRNIIDPRIRKNRHTCWSFLNTKSNYDELFPDNVLEFLEWC